MLEVSIKKNIGDFHLSSSFQIQKGVLGILGASGCGKSMTLKCLAGIETPTTGEIILNGRTLFSSSKKINLPARSRKIGYVFQNYALFPHLTVEQNIAYGLKNFSQKEKMLKVASMIERIHLHGLENRYPHQLSGGQQQRVALSRTLITEPDLLLLDEPFSALDTHVKTLLQKELLTTIQENFNGITLLVTHNIEEAYRLCDTILVMEKGKIAQLGTKREIIHSPTSLASAQMSGCKNLFHVDLLTQKDDFVTLQVQNLVLKIRKPKGMTLSPQMMIGIHAHHLTIGNPVKNENTFSCQLVKKLEGVFSSSLLLEANGLCFEAELPHTHPLLPILSEGENLTLTLPIEHLFIFPIEKPQT